MQNVNSAAGYFRYVAVCKIPSFDKLATINSCQLIINFNRNVI
jgi:hypothetical protein